jgi:hypothetical protein
MCLSSAAKSLFFSGPTAPGCLEVLARNHFGRSLQAISKPLQKLERLERGQFVPHVFRKVWWFHAANSAVKLSADGGFKRCATNESNMTSKIICSRTRHLTPLCGSVWECCYQSCTCLPRWYQRPLLKRFGFIGIQGGWRIWFDWMCTSPTKTYPLLTIQPSLKLLRAKIREQSLPNHAPSLP